MNSHHEVSSSLRRTYMFFVAEGHHWTQSCTYGIDVIHPARANKQPLEPANWGTVQVLRDVPFTVSADLAC